MICKTGVSNKVIQADASLLEQQSSYVYYIQIIFLLDLKTLNNLDPSNGCRARVRQNPRTAFIVLMRGLDFVFREGVDI